MIHAKATIIGEFYTADNYDPAHPPETVQACEIHSSGSFSALVTFNSAKELKDAIMSGEPVTITFGE